MHHAFLQRVFLQWAFLQQTFLRVFLQRESLQRAFLQQTAVVVFATAGLLLGGTAVAADRADHAGHADRADQKGEASVAPLLTRELGDIEGKEVVMLTVEYAPGQASPPHRHNAHTFVYVLEGALLMGVAGQEPQRLEVGQTFYESPSDIHAVGRNASTTEPAKFLVFFVKDRGAPTTVPAG